MVPRGLDGGGNLAGVGGGGVIRPRCPAELNRLHRDAGEGGETPVDGVQAVPAAHAFDAQIQGLHRTLPAASNRRHTTPVNLDTYPGYVNPLPPKGIAWPGRRHGLPAARRLGHDHGAALTRPITCRTTG